MVISLSSLWATWEKNLFNRFGFCSSNLSSFSCSFIPLSPVLFPLFTICTLLSWLSFKVSGKPQVFLLWEPRRLPTIANSLPLLVTIEDERRLPSWSLNTWLCEAWDRCGWLVLDQGFFKSRLHASFLKTHVISFRNSGLKYTWITPVRSGRAVVR